MAAIKPLLVSFSLLALVGANAYSQEGSKDRNSQPVPSPTKPGPATAEVSTGAKVDRSSFRPARDLIGKEVTNWQGEDLGEIKDLIVDLKSGTVHAAVLEFGGFLGMGEKQYAFPVSELSAAMDPDKLLLNVDRSRLKSARGFERNQWPAMDDEYWTQVGGKADAKGGAYLIRASELMGKNLQDQSGREAGEIEDVMVDLATGRITNVAIDVDGGGQAMVPAEALSAGLSDRLVVNMTVEQLRTRSKNANEVSERNQPRGAPGR